MGAREHSDGGGTLEGAREHSDGDGTLEGAREHSDGDGTLARWGNVRGRQT